MAAQGSEVCRQADPSQFVSKGACEVLSCGPEPGCVCVQTVGHVPTCVQNFDPTDPNDCPATSTCSERRPCKNGFVCAKLEGCCGTGIRTCLRPCRA